MDNNFSNLMERVMQVDIAEGSDTAKIKAKIPGLLKIPEGKSFSAMPLKHYVDLAKQMGKGSVLRGFNNLVRWNESKNPEVCSLARKMVASLKENSWWSAPKAKSELVVEWGAERITEDAEGQEFMEYSPEDFEKWEILVDGQKADEIILKKGRTPEDAKAAAEELFANWGVKPEFDFATATLQKAEGWEGEKYPMEDEAEETQEESEFNSSEEDTERRKEIEDQSGVATEKKIAAIPKSDQALGTKEVEKNERIEKKIAEAMSKGSFAFIGGFDQMGVVNRIAENAWKAYTWGGYCVPASSLSESDRKEIFESVEVKEERVKEVFENTSMREAQQVFRSKNDMFPEGYLLGFNESQLSPLANLSERKMKSFLNENGDFEPSALWLLEKLEAAAKEGRTSAAWLPVLYEVK